MNGEMRRFLQSVPGTRENLYRAFFKRVNSDEAVAAVTTKPGGKREQQKEVIIREYLGAIDSYAELVRKGVMRGITTSFFEADGNIYTTPALEQLTKLGYGAEVLLRDPRVILALRGVLHEELGFRDEISRQALGNKG